MANPTIETIRSRRAVRAFTEQPVAQADLETIVEAARWAPSAGNRRLQKFIVVRKPQRIRLIRTMSPGMSGYPMALIIICNDWHKAEREGLNRGDCNVFIDVGTSMENMLLAAHALGLAAGPVTSFSHAGLKVFLGLPDWLSPEIIICLGYPAQDARSKRVRPPKSLDWRELTFWEQYQTMGEE